MAGTGLFLVGAGWCMTFISGTAFLADSAGFEERGTLFGANDAAVAIVGSIAVVSAGFVYGHLGVIGLAILASVPRLMFLDRRDGVTSQGSDAVRRCHARPLGKSRRRDGSLRHQCS